MLCFVSQQCMQPTCAQCLVSPHVCISKGIKPVSNHWLGEYSNTSLSLCPPADRTGSLGCIGWFIVIVCGFFTLCFFPVTIWFCVKVSELSSQKSLCCHSQMWTWTELPLCCFLSVLQIVQEYERAVIFRLGRITDKKAKGPGAWLNFSH